MNSIKLISDVIAAVDRSETGEVELSGMGLELTGNDYMYNAISVGRGEDGDYWVFSGDFFAARLTEFTDQGLRDIWNDIYK